MYGTSSGQLSHVRVITHYNVVADVINPTRQEINLKAMSKKDTTTI
jgi:hypothetical protein